MKGKNFNVLFGEVCILGTKNTFIEYNTLTCHPPTRPRGRSSIGIARMTAAATVAFCGFSRKGSISRSRNNSGHGGGAAGGALPTESHPLEVGWLEREGRNRLAPRDNFLPSALISILQQDWMRWEQASAEATGQTWQTSYFLLATTMRVELFTPD